MRCFLFVLLIINLSFANSKLFVVQGLDETAGCIDVPSGDVNSQAVTLGNIPNEIITHNGMLYVTNSGYNNVQEIDPLELATTRELQIAGATNVWSMAFLNDDTMAVTATLSNNVTIVRLSDEAIIANIPTGIGPQCVIAHGEYFYVANTGVEFPVYNPGSVIVFDRHTLERVDSLSVGYNPWSMAVDESDRLHVVCTGDYAEIDGEVHVIDLDSRETIRIIETGGSPTQVSLSDSFAWIAAGGWVNTGYMFRYSLADFAVLNDDENPIETMPGAWDIEVMPNGELFVSCFAANSIGHYGADGTFLNSYEVSLGPGQMTVFDPTIEAISPPKMLPESVNLIKAYPNPFNSLVRLEFAEPFNQERMITIYNNIGQIVHTLAVPARAQHVTWDALTSSGSPLSSGVYHVVMDGVRHRSHKQLIYMK